MMGKTKKQGKIHMGRHHYLLSFLALTVTVTNNEAAAVADLSLNRCPQTLTKDDIDALQRDNHLYLGTGLDSRRFDIHEGADLLPGRVLTGMRQKSFAKKLILKTQGPENIDGKSYFVCSYHGEDGQVFSIKNNASGIAQAYQLVKSCPTLSDERVEAIQSLALGSSLVLQTPVNKQMVPIQPISFKLVSGQNDLPTALNKLRTIVPTITFDRLLPADTCAYTFNVSFGRTKAFQIQAVPAASR